MASTSNIKQQERNWLDLPSDVMANILSRIGMSDIFENAEKVCPAWLKICKDPAMWTVINMNDLLSSVAKQTPTNMCRLAVNRSQGQLVDITLAYAYNVTLLYYVAERSSQLRRLEMVYGFFNNRSMTNALMKFPMLEELNLYLIKVLKEEIETVGRYCPMLKTLKVNGGPCSSRVRDTDTDEWSSISYNEIAIAVGQNLLGIRHLELIGNKMTNVGLRVILDNCHHLETLDLRECFYIDLKGDLGKQCSKQIKYLKLPNDSLEGCPYIYNLSILDLFKWGSDPKVN